MERPKSKHAGNKYRCTKCGKETGQVYVVKQGSTVGQICNKCYWDKNLDKK
jgi:hypothetical protein